MIETKNMRQGYYHYYRKFVTNPISDVRLYLRVVDGLMKYIMRKVLEGNDVDLGSANTLGSISIRGKKQVITIDEVTGEVTGLPIDRLRTKQLWDSDPEAKEKKTKIYHLNEHSNGVRYHFTWWAKNMKVPNRTLYSLTFSDTNKEMLAARIRNGAEYVVIPKKLKKVRYEQTTRIEE